MKKHFLLLLMIFLITVISVSCSPAPLEDASESYNQPEPSVDTIVDTSKKAYEEVPEDYNKIFELDLFSDKTIYKTTENKLYSYDYVKSGGYSADDPKADFWKAFYNEKDLYLPEGDYTITVGGAFSLTDKGGNSNLTKKINITVVK
ncbi:MAG TPA: hypothetical protein VIO64_12900 [Pseudobacteroides sp.]|uniref:hypothetical protein n=1 Tax=Pseudobacteroides sp. TaxID=1968840 RepID=UPI002F95FA36